VPKSARPATKSLNIRNFVKPFDELEARRFLEKFGELDYFWLEGSQCFVTVRNLLITLEKWPEIICVGEIHAH
jgi:hypothetical protein